MSDGLELEPVIPKPGEKVKGPLMVFVSEAEGALPKGTRVAKCNSNQGDAHVDGDEGTVFSSLAMPDDMRDEYPGIDYAYWIVWDDTPDVPIAVTSDRITLL